MSLTIFPAPTGDLDDQDKIRIVNVFLSGTSVGDISTPLNVSRRTIESIIREGFRQTLELKVGPLAQPQPMVTVTDAQ